MCVCVFGGDVYMNVRKWYELEQASEKQANGGAIKQKRERCPILVPNVSSKNVLLLLLQRSIISIIHTDIHKQSEYVSILHVNKFYNVYLYKHDSTAIASNGNSSHSTVDARAVN